MNTPRVVSLLRELADALEQGENRKLSETTYTSTSLPPGITSREWFASECRRLKIGTKHGREWHVSAVEWLKAREAKRPKLRVVRNDEDAKIDEYIKASGGRPTRRT